MSKTGLLWLGGGVTLIGGALLAWKKSSVVTDDIETALEQPQSAGHYPTVAIHATGYWPYSARADEQKMEGGIKDRKGNTLYTLEQHLSDPSKYPYVSCAGDFTIWPYGQRVILSPWPKAIFRIVDTGGHFFGAKKVYRVVGEEPLDICVDSSKTVVPKSDVKAQIVTGDNFEKGKAVATSKIKDQTVAGYITKRQREKEVIGALERGDMEEVIAILKRRA